ncbi:pectate lyase [Verticillium alfalfae VaMs.102]|uniref:Pectate lyase n=1 Tax=Verticillium alfalfae (strain VaMs.102 / ATCC MYA-4576 / FGSC 10136) TaxID=526221 RepID=C9S5Q6_VERA1|nr:pectate lyase [Verticillium alfalfae VaMs.102]EEY14282.1 pectate lyase [Verticillium alfalfae VaMs.102]
MTQLSLLRTLLLPGVLGRGPDDPHDEHDPHNRVTTSTIKLQASGGVSCPHPAVNTVWPTPTGSTSYPTASVIPAGAVFDGRMALFDRKGSPGDCSGQKEQDEAAAVFILEPGATLRNAIIGPAQAEGVHCRGPCTIENVWWDDVCEDAATFKGAGPRYVRGGGAREASDKVFQHNVGVNQNYGDTAELSNYCLAKVGVVCTRYNGCVKPCEAGEVGEGELEPFCKINGDDWS